MSTIVEIVMPKLGESIMEATILKWHKNIGESIQMDETLLDIATDKVDSEVPSTAEGIVTEILFNTNDVVPIGAVIAKISSQQSNGISVPPATPSIQQQSVTTSTPAVVTQVMAQPEYAQSVYTAPTTVVSNNVTNRFYSPLVLNIASSEGVSMQELENITGSGNEGRVTKKDILQYVTEKKGGNGISIPNIPNTATTGFTTCNYCRNNAA
jgi:2-oxoglutarate dehydrogenase E2 component (dihydrolipoamide succinyltransferase)